jgi:hypothetical protein
MHPSIVIDRPTNTTERNTTMTQTTNAGTTTGRLIYRFEAQLGELFPVGIFDEGIRFHNNFAGRIVDGPFAGARIYGLDEFLMRPDGVGEVTAPEAIDAGDVRAAVHVRGYVVPPAEMEPPPLEALLQPDFEFPDVPFRFTGSATVKTTAPQHAWMNSTIAVLEGTVNMGTGRIEVEARAA